MDQGSESKGTLSSFLVGWRDSGMAVKTQSFVSVSLLVGVFFLLAEISQLAVHVAPSHCYHCYRTTNTHIPSGYAQELSVLLLCLLYLLALLNCWQTSILLWNHYLNIELLCVGKTGSESLKRVFTKHLLGVCSPAVNSVPANSAVRRKSSMLLSSVTDDRLSLPQLYPSFSSLV